MLGDAAYRIAQDAIAASAKIELAEVCNHRRMIPTERNATDGIAKNPNDQEAADAWNWFAENPRRSGDR